MDTQLPDVFKDLARALNKEPGTLERAKMLGDALKAIPDLQSHLRELRRQDINTVRDRDGLTYADMQPVLEMDRHRISAIARNAPSGKQIAKAKAAGDN
jgi:hypothetical protein